MPRRKCGWAGSGLGSAQAWLNFSTQLRQPNPHRNRLRATRCTLLHLAPMASSTQRSREHRARKRQGWACFKLWLPAGPLAATLAEAGWLGACAQDDPEPLHAALEGGLLEWAGVGPA